MELFVLKYTNIIILVFSLASVSTWLLSCGTADGVSDAAATATAATTTTSSSGSSSNSCSGGTVTAADLVGTWTTTDECLAGGGVGSLKRQYVFTTTTVTITLTGYQNSPACDGATGYRNIVYTYDYTLCGAATGDSNATNINYTIASIEYTSIAAGVTDDHNINDRCGFDGSAGNEDWSSNIPKDITGRTCSSSGISFIFETVGQSIYDIVKIDGTTLNFSSIITNLPAYSNMGYTTTSARDSATINTSVDFAQ